MFSNPAPEDELKSLIDRYLKPLFAFCLSYRPYTREQAFQITVSAFADTLRERLGLREGNQFLETLFRNVLAGCGRMAPVGVSGLEAFGLAPSPQQTSLAIVREALMRVSSDDRAVLLLRDQCHLPLDQVAAVMGVSGREIQRICLTARERLRMKVKEELETPERKNGL